MLRPHERGGNVLDIFHSRTMAHTQVGEVAIDLVIETRGGDHLEELEAALRAAGILEFGAGK